MAALRGLRLHRQARTAWRIQPEGKGMCARSAISAARSAMYFSESGVTSGLPASVSAGSRQIAARRLEQRRDARPDHHARWTTLRNWFRPATRRSVRGNQSWRELYPASELHLPPGDLDGDMTPSPISWAPSGDQRRTCSVGRKSRQTSFRSEHFRATAE